jgi:hypothetical protein
MNYNLEKMIGKLREDASLPPPHIKENTMAAIRAESFSVKQTFAWRYAIGVAILVVMGTGGTVWAAQQSAPGNVLYPIKRASETAYVGFQFNPQAQINVQQAIIDRRVAEAEQIANMDADGFDDQLAEDTATASEAWVNAQEQAFSNDIQLAAW